MFLIAFDFRSAKVMSKGGVILLLTKINNLNALLCTMEDGMTKHLLNNACGTMRNGLYYNLFILWSVKGGEQTRQD